MHLGPSEEVSEWNKDKHESMPRFLPVVLVLVCFRITS
jgi:hypothetical protein